MCGLILYHKVVYQPWISSRRKDKTNYRGARRWRLWCRRHEVRIRMTSERTRFVSCCMSPATSRPAVNNFPAQLCLKRDAEEVPHNALQNTVMKKLISERKRIYYKKLALLYLYIFSRVCRNFLRHDRYCIHSHPTTNMCSMGSKIVLRRD